MYSHKARKLVGNRGLSKIAMTLLLLFGYSKKSTVASYNDISLLTGLASHSSISRGLKELKRLGLIEVTKDFPRPNTYKVL